MFKAINLATNELIDALAIYNDSCYLKPKDDKWIAPKDEILNWEELKEKGITEVPVLYRSESVKPYKTKPGNFKISPCFYIKDKEKYNIQTTIQDVLHHKLLNWFFNYVLQKNPELKFIYSTYYIKGDKKENVIDIKNLPIDVLSYGMEVNIENGKKVRADLFVKFLKRDNFFGDGIIFEIQLTKQKDEKFEERTLDRAITGFSVCWLNGNDFEEEESDNFVLKNNSVILHPFAEIIKKQRVDMFKKWKDITQDFSRLMVEKVEDCNEKIYTCMENLEDEFDDVKNTYENHKKLIEDIRKDEFSDFKKHLREIIDNINTDKLIIELRDMIKTELNEEIINDFKNDIMFSFSSEIKSVLSEFEIIKYITEQKCPVCNSPLKFVNGSFGDFIGCSMWPTTKCEFKIPLNYIYKKTKKE